MSETRLTSADLVPDEPLDRLANGSPIGADLDSLNHRGTAKRIAELVSTQDGRLNVAVFGPWGSGKSSFFALLRSELRTDKQIIPVHFDAWQNAGEGFHSNFLSALGSEAPGGLDSVDEELFTSRKSVNLPFGLNLRGSSKPRMVLIALALVVVVLFLVPLLWSMGLNWVSPVPDFWAFFRNNALAWVGLGASGTVALILITLLMDLATVTVDTAVPSHVAQFRVLFNKIVKSGKGKKFVIFVDELDRCAPEDVMSTLEGLRTFLGHDKCVFVVAFDRDAITDAISSHSPHSVPVRRGAAYYSTAGEYLDKIFQFQVSLPPQPRHMSRRFALSLVRGKHGVWGDIKRQSDRGLERVVSILSPVHVRSPRRTKVLLNDFAVNARIYETLGFDWLSRAEEIAAWTVIQTEFPRLAADLEREPGLLPVLAGMRAATRPALAELGREYSGSDGRPLDQLVDSSPRDEAGAAESHESETTGRITADLYGSLHNFIRRLVDMNCRLPNADLILQHSGDDLLKFEDVAIYNAVVSATELTRAEFLDALREGSEADRVAALGYLLAGLEEALPEEGTATRPLIGELASGLDPSTILPLLDGLSEAWRSGDARGELERIDGPGAAGFARGFAVQGGEAIDIFLEQAQSLGASVETASIAVIVGESSDGSFASSVEGLLARIAPHAVADPALLKSILRRVDATQVDASKFPSMALIVETLSVAKPVKVEPGTGTTAAIAAAKEEDESNIALYEAELAASIIAGDEILSIWSELRGDGSTRDLLLDVLRRLPQEQWSLRRHDDLIRAELDAGFRDTAARYVVRAIADRPETASARWTALLPAGADVQAALFSVALASVAKPAMLPNSNLATRRDAIANLEGLASLSSSAGSLEFSATLEAAQKFLSEPVATRSGEEVAAAVGLARALDLFEQDEFDVHDLLANLFVGEMEFVVDDDERAEPLFQLAGSLPEKALGVIEVAAVDFLEQSDSTNEEIRAKLLLAVQVELAKAGSHIHQLAFERLEDVGPAALDELADLWVRTVPDPLEVSALLDAYPSIPITTDAWKSYSGGVTEEDRTNLWRRLSAGGELMAAAAVASAGLEDAAYDQLADTVLSGQTVESRKNAQIRLSALPRDVSAYRNAVSRVAIGLAESRTKGDLNTVVPLLLGTDGFSSKQVSQISAAMTPWVKASQGFVPRGQVERLIHKGLLARKDKASYFPATLPSLRRRK